MIEEGVFATQDYLVVTLTPLNHETLVHFDSNLAFHFVSDAQQLALVDDANVELGDHLARVVRVVVAELRLIVVDLLISLTEEVVEAIALDGRVASLGLGDVVAETMRVCLEGLALGLAREEEAAIFTVTHAGRHLNVFVL